MSRKSRIEEAKKEVSSSIEKLEKEGTSPYTMSRVNYYRSIILEEKLDDISERLQLIETALGLIAAKEE
jgi:hypothetical protein